jgi:hypothetical protein
MDKSHPNAGIAIERICLLECHVSNVKPDVAPNFNLGLTSIRRELSSDAKMMFFTVGFDLMSRVENPVCRLTCGFGATYSRSLDANMSWDEFSDAIALAQLIPYVRELVTNLTTRLPLPVLVLPPLNSHQLIREYNELTLAQHAAKVPASV